MNFSSEISIDRLNEAKIDLDDAILFILAIDNQTFY